MPSYRIIDFWSIYREYSWTMFFIVLIFMAITIIFEDELKELFNKFDD